MRFLLEITLFLLASSVSPLSFSVTLHRVVLPVFEHPKPQADHAVVKNTPQGEEESNRVQGIDDFLVMEDADQTPIETANSSGVLPSSFQLLLFNLEDITLSSSSMNIVPSETLTRVTVRRSLVGLDGLEDNQLYPEEAESSTEGLVRLVCNKLDGSIFEMNSFPNMPPVGPTLPSIFLVPVSEPQPHPLYNIIHLLFGIGADVPLRYALLVSHERDSIDLPLLPQLNWSSCILRILPLQEQTKIPAGSFVKEDGQVLVGDAVLRGSSAPELVVTSDTAGDLSQNFIALTCGIQESHSKAANELNPNTTTNTILHVPSNSDQPVRTDLTISEFVEDYGFAGMVAPIISGIVKPLVEPFGGVVTDLLGGSLTDSMGQQLSAGMDDLVSTELARSISPAVSQQLVPTLGETLTDTVPEKTAHITSVYVTKELTKRMTENLVQRFKDTLGKEVPEIVDRSVPNEVDVDLIRALGRVLPKALAHSVVPALVHTLTHTPLQDYYCYFCFNEREYCSYCNYSPQQLYYAMYYAGWYSTWYADYYCDFYAKVLDSVGTDSGTERLTRGELQKIGKTTKGSEVALVLNPDTWHDSARSVTRDDSIG